MHRDLLDQPGRRRLQGLRPHLPRSAALDRDDAGEKRATWRRITREGTAWRFNHYAERAGDAEGTARGGAAPTEPVPIPLPPHDAARPAPGLRRIAPLAWPVFVGQVAVLAFGTIDTVLVARTTATDLAALAVGAAVYISVFVGLMGIVLSIGPIAGQLFGAGKVRECGDEVQQAIWLAIFLAAPGCLLLLVPDPFLALSRAEPIVAAKVRTYLAGAGVRVASGARLHCLSRLQRRGVAAEGGDGDADDRPRAEGRRSVLCSSSARRPGRSAAAPPALGAAGCGSPPRS